MTLVSAREKITVNGTDYEVSEEVTASPEAILSLESAQAVVLARRINGDGSLATMQQYDNSRAYPVAPPEEDMKANPKLRRAFQEECLARLEAMKNDPEEVLVPPTIGHVQTNGNEDYFQLNPFDTSTPSILPFEGTQRQTSLLYRLQVSEIVE